MSGIFEISSATRAGGTALAENVAAQAVANAITAIAAAIIGAGWILGAEILMWGMAWFQTFAKPGDRHDGNPTLTCKVGLRNSETSQLCLDLRRSTSLSRQPGTR
jgi:hypothetical protein